MYRIFKQHRIDIDAYKYDANSVTIIRNDIERIQRNPLHYLPSMEKEGAIHIIDENVSNSIDEMSAPKKGGLGGDVLVRFEEKGRVVSVTDTGRGFPHETLFDMLEVMNSSAKMGNKDRAYNTSTGAFGMGVKITNALSEYFKIITERDGKRIEVYYENGKRKDVKESKSSDTGTYIEFKINKKYFDSYDITCQDVIDMLLKKAYVMNPKVGLIFTGVPKKGNEIIKEFRGLTIKDYIKQFPITSDIYECHASLGTSSVKILFGYDMNNTTETIAAAYTNGMYNKALGSHYDGFLDGLSSYIREYMYNSYLSEKDKKDLKIKIDDFKSGLVMAVVATVLNPKFRGGQHKEELASNEIKNLASRTVKAYLRNMDNAKLNRICNIVRSNAKARTAGENIRKKNKKDVTNAFSADRLSNYVAISKYSTSKFREIFMSEGLSSKDALRSASDDQSQAVLALRGRVENIFDLSPMEALKHSTFLETIVQIYDCGYGDTFNIEKFPFDRVNLAGDADVDGDAIAAELAVIHAKCFRQLILAGKVYRVVPPLYEVNQNGKNIFLATNRELYELTQRNFAKEHKLHLDSNRLKESEIIELLTRNYNYMDGIDYLSKQHILAPSLCEFIIDNMDIGFNADKVDKWNKTLRKKFRFIDAVADGKFISFRGMADNQYTNFDYSEEFIEDLEDNLELVDGLSGYSIDSPDANLSLYELLQIFNKYTPKILDRFKGLGQMDSADLRRSLMDRKARHSIRLTMSDVNKTYEQLAVMHSKKQNNSIARKKFMSNYKCNTIDIDT